ncbi:MAG: 4-hydroxybenzoyl-CoA thioesterase family active site [uncultured Sulfurovum sp.]|uniref:4-hydroxybenzoyl-CoA thioesterase family active site n=1 Tax=uncultured Sulfurovum sp. TaxID=269237 RepID=A0A6S6UAJ5_9BACT|nr:MAG: 4-hydroxybenzoyl-CoA thioesterase family active site [uncultured Sulfurovum sp.]
MQIRIYYEDTDAGGITYHANYIKFCERARSEYLLKQDIMPGGSDFGFVVRHMEVDYYATSTLGDILEVKSKILRMKNSSLLVSHKIYKEKTKIFSMNLSLVYVEKGTPKRIPEYFRKLFSECTYNDC